MNRSTMSAVVLAALLAASAALAQSPKVLFIGERPVADVERTFHLKPGSSETGNSALLQSGVDNTSQVYSIGFGGKVWALDKTIVTGGGGRRFIGNGLHNSDKGDAVGIHTANPSRLLWGGGTVTFNGGGVTATTSGASDTITVSGAAARNEDLLNTVEITGGTNFIQGVYQIVAVNEGTNTCQLDRVCTSGSGSAMTGRKKGTVWRDQGYGNVFEGLNFRGTPTFGGTTTPNTRAAIAWHQRPSVDGITTATGKVAMRDCTFANFDVGLLFGKGLAKFDYDPTSSEAADDYDGENHNHADHFEAQNLHFQGCRYGVVLRNEQSLHHVYSNINFRSSFPGEPETMFYIERGGNLTARGLLFTSGFANGPTLLRLGGAGGSVGSTIYGPIVLDSINFDAPSPDHPIAADGRQWQSDLRGDDQQRSHRPDGRACQQPHIQRQWRNRYGVERIQNDHDQRTHGHKRGPWSLAGSLRRHWFYSRQLHGQER